MSNTLFSPRRADGRALWRVAFDYVIDGLARKEFDNGDIISHQQMAAAIGIDYPSPSYSQSVNRAISELQKEHGWTLVIQKGQGYQVAKGMAQLDKGRKEQESSRRKLDKAIGTVATINEDGLSPGQVTTVRQLQNGLQFLGQVMSRTVTEQEEMKKDLEMLKQDRITNRQREYATEGQMARMQERLDKLESERDPFSQ